MKQNELIPIEQKGKRVLTSKQLAECYGANDTMIKQNYNNNKERFIEGKHYYYLKGEDLKEFLQVDNIDLQNIGINNPSKVRSLYLWTEAGALRHAKILDTDKAWEVYEMLEETYFAVKEKIIPMFTEEQKLQLKIFDSNTTKEEAVMIFKQLQEIKNQQIALLQPKADKWEKFVSQDGCLTFTEVSKIMSTQAKEDNIKLSITGTKLTELLRNEGILSKNKSHGSYLNVPNKEYENYFNTTSIDISHDGNTFKKTTTKVNSKGLDFIYGLLTKKIPA